LKISARITAVFPSSEPRKANLSLLPHIINLDIAKTSSGQVPLDPLEALPVGFLVESAKVIEVIEDQGVYVHIGLEDVSGFVHVFPFL
jgi:hypothetical protein